MSDSIVPDNGTIRCTLQQWLDNGPSLVCQYDVARVELVDRQFLSVGDTDISPKTLTFMLYWSPRWPWVDLNKHQVPLRFLEMAHDVPTSPETAQHFVTRHASKKLAEDTLSQACLAWAKITGA